MLELKKIKKTYNSKKGNDTIALNDINLTIGNSGMIFFVGKSGSGKSTLLNLLGGLDTPTSGQILINNEDISKFKKKDYDSYRNTYIGFVFQEFNILEQYNVYENIELSMQLQKKKITKEEIDILLKNLGIENLGNRKINELSGGQKQRVAIARALIKKPKIILADEPTGNLDSNSSSQIFDILKNISKTQLIIVVSHDMDSAKKYGDRIITIEDGKITEDKKAVETDDNSLDEFELKKSKLPFSYALKMAVNSLKVRPLKLIMTIILTTISLIFMGITVNCALFDSSLLEANTMIDNENNIFDIYNRKINSNGSSTNVALTEDDYKQISADINSIINVGYSLYDNDVNLNFDYGESNVDADSDLNYYRYEPGYFTYVEVTDDRIYENLIGKKAVNSDELVIHKHLADYIIKFGVIDEDGNLYKPSSYNDLVNSNKLLKLGNNSVKVVGIIEDDDNLYKEAKETGKFKNADAGHYYYENYVVPNSVIYVSGFTNTVDLRVNKSSVLEKINLEYKSLEGNNFLTNPNITSLNEQIDVINENGTVTCNSLEKDEVLISIDSLKEINQDFNDKLEIYIKANSSKSYKEIVEEFTINYIKEKKNLDFINLMMFDGSSDSSIEISVNVRGITLDENNYVSNNIVENYNPITKISYSVKVYENKFKNLKNTFENYKLSSVISSDDEIEAGTYYVVSIPHESDITNVILVYKELYKYILIVSLVFVLFTLLLFSNFIAVSISYCKKEIGILRAIGAKENDVIKIFAYESIIIGIISWIISIIGWYLVCHLLNNSMFGDLNYTLNGIVTHPLIPIGMLIYTIIISISITILSITRITNIKPIDAINNK